MPAKKPSKSKTTTAGKKVQAPLAQIPAQPVRELVQQPAAQLGELPQGYAELLEDLKARIRSSQIKAAVAVNRGLIALYWQIGQQIVDRQGREAWGTGVLDRLARDLVVAFPGVEGFSARNLWRMRALYLA